MYKTSFAKCRSRRALAFFLLSLALFFCCLQLMHTSQTFWKSVGAESCLLEMCGPAGRLYRIFKGPGRLESMAIFLSFMRAWGTGILEASALIRALFMLQTIYLIMLLDFG